VQYITGTLLIVTGTLLVVRYTDDSLRRCRSCSVRRRRCDLSGRDCRLCHEESCRQRVSFYESHQRPNLRMIVQQTHDNLTITTEIKTILR